MASSFNFASVLLLTSLVGSALGWGGLFNRYNPSMLSNLGYGSSYGRQLYRASDQALNNVPSVVDEVLAEEAAEDSPDNDPCHGKKCTANEHCCDGHVCVDTEDEANDVTFGSCLPIFGKKQGEACYRDNDCESGFLCLKDEDGGKTCQTPVPGTLGLGEECRTSSDCNTNKGLCCKLQRRARSQPKKICAYYTDSQTCIGPVAVAPNSHEHAQMEHTAGEKRVSGHPDYHHFRR